MAMLNKEFILHIGGEATKSHSIPVDMLVDIAKNLQELILKLAEYDISTNEPIDLNNFKIELSKFEKGSAVPTFIFTPSINISPIGAIEDQRDKVVDRFTNIMSLANTGNYLKLKEVYQEPFKRNEIVSSVYSFVDSFKNAPVQILDYKHKPIYSIKRFKKSVKDAMITEIKEPTKGLDREKSYRVAKVQIVKERGKNKILNQKVIELFDSKKVAPGYSTDTIVAGNTVYELNYHLYCTVETFEGITKIESDMLGIFGHGATIDDAEKSFAEEFDFIYQRYNELSNKKLTKDVQSIKNRINQLVKNIS